MTIKNKGVTGKGKPLSNVSNENRHYVAWSVVFQYNPEQNVDAQNQGKYMHTYRYITTNTQKKLYF